LATQRAAGDREPKIERMEPSVSVILPVYNAAPFVTEAVASVDAQSWPDLRLVIVDDGSTDATPRRLAEIAEAWDRPTSEIEIVTQTNAGAGAARNTALSHAVGEFVVFMDADDVLHPGLIDRLVSALRADPAADLVFPDHRYIDASSAPTGFTGHSPPGRFEAVDLVIDNPIHSATGVMARRDAVVRSGGFDPTLRACIDLDLWVRIACLRPGNIVPVGEVLADYRKNEGQITSDWERMEAGWSRVVDKLAAAGRPLTDEEYRRARARSSLYWSAIAYEAGKYRDARRLIARAWVGDPLFAIRSPLARIRALACLASLLPAPIHDGLRARNHRRSRGAG
jgi:glycosyltransferase involved in cell wall biosynthesis